MDEDVCPWSSWAWAGALSTSQERECRCAGRTPENGQAQQLSRTSHKTQPQVLCPLESSGNSRAPDHQQGLDGRSLWPEPSRGAELSQG